MSTNRPQETTTLTSGKIKQSRTYFFGQTINLYGGCHSINKALRSPERALNIAENPSSKLPSESEDTVFDNNSGIQMIRVREDNTALASLNVSFQANNQGDISSLQGDTTENKMENHSPEDDNITTGFKLLTSGVSNMWTSIWDIDWSCGMCRRFNFESTAPESQPLNPKGPL